MDSLKIYCISDLHGNLPDIPKCELLLICGDIIPLEIQFDNSNSKNWLLNKFKNWCNNLSVYKILFIAGNHDQFMERNDSWMHKQFPIYSKITYLKNELYTFIDCYGKEYKIFGTPYCHQFGNWPFMRSNEILKEKYSKIPENLDILFTHDAPDLGTVGYINQNVFWGNKNVGNIILSEFILNKTPKYVVCGHIHSGNHNWETINNIKLCNCSLVDEHYNITYSPILINL